MENVEMRKMKLIIAGSRNFSDYKLLSAEVDSFRLEYPGEYEIISGTARGADQLGAQYAKEHNLLLTKMPANWSFYGISAGHRRNKEMAKTADACICFWDGKSKGTKNMIDLAYRYQLGIKIIKYKG